MCHPHLQGTSGLEMAHIVPWAKVKAHSFDNLSFAEFRSAAGACGASGPTTSRTTSPKRTGAPSKGLLLGN